MSLSSPVTPKDGRCVKILFARRPLAQRGALCGEHSHWVDAPSGCAVSEKEGNRSCPSVQSSDE